MLATSNPQHFQPSSPKQITTPPRKRSPRSRLTTPTHSRLTSPPSRAKSAKSVGGSPKTPIASQSDLFKIFKSCKKKSPKSIIKKEILKLDVIANDWICPATPSKGKKNKFQCDRFIPVRETMGEPSEQLRIPQRESGKEQYLNSNELEYQEKLAEACGVSLEKRILAFNLQPPSSQKDDLRQLYNQPMKLSTIQFKRRILTSPERVLDAPGLLDDYYLNLLDWSIKNMVAIGLDQCVYIWNADTGGVTSLERTNPGDYIASLSWSYNGDYLAVGTSDGHIQIWDVLKEQKIRSMLGHTARVGVITWNKHIISSGCKDGNIWHHDTRVAQHKVAELIDHTSEVCGLKWNSNGDQLASGGNDNRVNIWDARASTPRLTKNNHVAAVKALAWCPWQSHILASGGGSYDRHIHFWNVSSGARVKSIDTGSQVTSIIWSKDFKELLSTHGFPNHNMTIWSYPTLNKTADIPAHESRILHSTISPDNQVVATAASDENLKFWRVFQNARKNEKSKNSDKENTGSVFGGCTIR
ncbi:unnamed protein product [Rhizophagus irregularis]|uniref:CDC20/Fizzy WD40 domain-containing protein n=1 Tax=Rhizophagus irregularis TaxID=588596 RepID=A0A915YWP5_9GLOM|nr:unnamed protein product [Rhizophagus irregularis]CAB5350990.1 unnamed protein product [Rhizophagus irregularis]